MRGLILACLLLVAPASAGDITFAEEPCRVQALEFEIATPEGWERLQNHRNLVVRSRDQTGFIVSREPFLHDPKRFGPAWEAELRAAGKKVKVTPTKVGRLEAWRANWTAGANGERDIEVWRLRVPGSEMLYNFSFSGAMGTDFTPLVGPLFKSFNVTAPKPSLAFQQQRISLGSRFSIMLPQGYAKVQQVLNLGEVAFYYGGHYVTYLYGYKEPHLAGRISVRTLTADRPIGMADGRVIQTTNARDMSEAWWEVVEMPLVGGVVGKPKMRSARFAGAKGATVMASALSKNGLPKRVFIYVGRMKLNVLIMSIVVDEREALRHKKLFKQICSQLKAER
ncbi:MAG: hypothetical protein ACYTDU_14805 [Planctomycetota bacterium]